VAGKEIGILDWKYAGNPGLNNIFFILFVHKLNLWKSFISQIVHYSSFFYVRYVRPAETGFYAIVYVGRIKPKIKNHVLNRSRKDEQPKGAKRRR
jgi:hypothetical protein